LDRRRDAGRGWLVPTARRWASSATPVAAAAVGARLKRAGWFLMYLPDPVAALPRATKLLRPGSLICVLEEEMAYNLEQSARPSFIETVMARYA
jgi:hypothetical protein